MTLHYNRHRERDKRRSLRNNATQAELQLWSVLKGRQLGIKFRRQHSIDAFVVDFYAPSCRLAIEVDGEAHDSSEAKQYDLERTAYLQRFGIRVLRFSNAEVVANEANPTPTVAGHATAAPLRAARRAAAARLRRQALP
ncbi:MAG: DUF559 domain-containing protein [Deltaproteobacteria bacterium]|nr:DUF559 domain-containing protein [Deltaproteobacteria bacterium]